MFVKLPDKSAAAIRLGQIAAVARRAGSRQKIPLAYVSVHAVSPASKIDRLWLGWTIAKCWATIPEPSLARLRTSHPHPQLSGQFSHNVAHFTACEHYSPSQSGRLHQPISFLALSRSLLSDSPVTKRHNDCFANLLNRRSRGLCRCA